jgi:hypothetical protein
MDIAPDKRAPGGFMPAYGKTYGRVFKEET